MEVRRSLGEVAVEPMTRRVTHGVVAAVKSSERLLKARLSRGVDLCEQQQHGFMPRKSSTDSLFALRVSKRKYR